MAQEPDDPGAQKSQRYLLIGLTVALLAWGAFLGVGSFLGGANLRGNAGRGLVIFGCVGLFLAFWWLMLLTRKQGGGRDRN